MKILALDSSGLVASVAVLDDEKLIGEYTVDYKKTHSQTLIPMLETLTKLIELDIREEERASFLGVKRNKLVRFMDEKRAKNNKAEIVSDAKALLDSSDVADLTIDQKTRRIENY